MCFNVMVGRVLDPGRYPHLLHMEYFALHGKGNFAVVIKNLEMDRLSWIIWVGQNGITGVLREKQECQS